MHISFPLINFQNSLKMSLYLELVNQDDSIKCTATQFFAMFMLWFQTRLMSILAEEYGFGKTGMIKRYISEITHLIVSGENKKIQVLLKEYLLWKLLFRNV